jgi:membrane protease YdiL (CAAX protease family)
VPGYTRQQLIAAKAGVIGITSLATGWFLGREEGDYAASILVAAAIFGIMATGYELLASWLASWLGGDPGVIDAPGLPETAATDATPLHVDTQPLRLIDGVKVLAAFLGAQLIVWVIAVVAVMDPGSGHNPTEVGTRAVMQVFPVALPLSMLASALAVFGLSRRFSRRVDAGLAHVVFALRGADARTLAIAAGSGALLATLLALLSFMTPAGNAVDQGLLARMLSSSATGRMVFALTAVLIAPTVEEYVFRGVLLGTLLPAGEVTAGVVSGLAFWLLHATEWIHYWPAALGVGAMTVLVTDLRLRSGSIAPCIVAHTSYNGALTLIALLG